MFFAKYDSSGNYQWAYDIGNNQNDAGFGIAVDSYDNVYITGAFKRPNVEFDPAGVAHTPSSKLSASNNNKYDAFFAKYETPAKAPDVPVVTSPLVVDDGEVTVEWTAPGNDGGSAITGYTVTAIPADPTILVDPVPTCSTVPTDANPLSCTIGGLVNGVEYNVVVVVTNADAFDATSDPETVTPLGAPDVPVVTSPLEVGDSQVTVEWTAPGNDGGSAITGYTVEKDCGSGWVEVATVDAATLSHTVTGLVNGVSCDFRVLATNSVGDTASNMVEATPDVTPGVVDDLSATGGDEQVVLGWTAPEVGDGAGKIGRASCRERV